MLIVKLGSPVQKTRSLGCPMQLFCLRTSGVARRVTQERPLQTSIRLPSLCSLQQPPPPPPPRTLAPVCLLREDPASLNFLHFLFHHYGNHRLALFRHFSLKEGTRGRGGGGQRRSATPEVLEAITLRRLLQPAQPKGVGVEGAASFSPLRPRQAQSAVGK